MIKKLRSSCGYAIAALVILMLLPGIGRGQTAFTATYNFAGGIGNVASLAYNGTIYAEINPGPLVKVGVTTASSNGNSRATGWPTGATSGSDVFTGTVDVGKYIGFTIDAASGYKFTITSITFGIGRSGTGTRQCEWRGSYDSYEALISDYSALNASLTNTSGVLTNPDVNSSWIGNELNAGSNYIDINTSAGFRIYLFNSEAAAGTAGLQGNITIAGTFQAVGGLPIAATPTFNPSGGTYYSAQNVSLSCATASSSIYYTTDGTDPDNAGNGTLYNLAIPVSSTTTIKAKAYADGNDPSSIATSVYTFPTINDVADIAALRAGTTGSTVYKLTGEAFLTYQNAATKQKFIQDATAAILIYDLAGTITTSYNLYDGITGIYGTLTDYNGMLEFIPVLNTAAASSTGNVIIPEDRTLASLTSADQAKLIKVINATLDYSTGNFLAYAQNINVTQDITTLTMRTIANTDYSNTAIPTVAQNITCLVGQYIAAMQISPRFLADFETYTEPTTTYTGTGDWTDAGNWSNGIPTSAKDAIIDGNVTIDVAAETKDLTIINYQTVTINDTKSLTVNGTLTNYHGTSGLTINSGASLIQSSADVQATVNRTITDATDNKWHYFISPIIESVQASGTSCFAGAYVDRYNEPTGAWVRLNTDENVTSTQGYSLNYLAGSRDLVFTGTLKSSPVSYTDLSYTPSAAINDDYAAGWHLVGNPYPCGINPALLSVPTGINAYAYIPNGASGNYDPLTIGSAGVAGTIASLQGFFVRSISGTNSLTLANAAKVHGGTFFKTSNISSEMLSLSIEGNNYSDKTYVRFNTDATANFDQAYDAYKRSGLDAAPQLYSILTDEKAAVNTLPDYTSNSNVPLGLKVGAATTYTLTITGMEIFDPNTPIRLDDLKLGTSLDVRINPVYSFTAAPGDAENRFRLRFASAIGIDETATGNFSIFAAQGQVHVIPASPAEGTVYVYSVSGNLVAGSTLNTGETLIGINTPGVYLVKVVTSKTVTSGKVVIN